MEDNKFLENFAFQFDETDPGSILLDTHFKKLDEWSSLIALSVMAMADEQYRVKITADDIKNSTTVNDILLLIKERS
ncbi:acyl carrier protein [Pedobacter ginsengisoli]|uniref:acyl carrier protein n=1 Tax=Pedobacter ginsengisoli TaxID=363852 RepID=UPI00254E934F|nr:acyl carrier protein [Pedobacter ginsengisoli]